MARPLLAVLVPVTIVLGIASKVGVGASAIKPSTSPTFPVASAARGDWEISRGARGSFQITKTRVKAVVTSGPEAGDHVWVIETLGENLVIVLRADCKSTSGSAREPVTFTLPSFGFAVASTGSVDRVAQEKIPTFSFTIDGTTVTGGGGSPGTIRLVGTIEKTRANLTFSFLGKGIGNCSIPRTRFAARLGRRLSIADGQWRGTSATGEPVLFAVVGNGRAVAQATIAGNTDPGASPGLILSFRFGEGCTSDANIAGGYSCATTDGSIVGWPVDPCLHASATNAFISTTGATNLGLSNYGASGGSPFPSPAPSADAGVTMQFTSPTTVTGIYSQPGSASCSSSFTASGP